LNFATITSLEIQIARVRDFHHPPPLVCQDEIIELQLLELRGEKSNFFLNALVFCGARGGMCGGKTRNIFVISRV
jgi:hypothetical protein